VVISENGDHAYRCDTINVNRMGKTRKIADLTLRLLRVFDAVARAGSFTAAEVLLNKSKSSISMDIAALETRLGLKLCRRGRGGFALTEQGKEVQALSAELFRHLHEFRDRVGDVAERVGGEVSVVMDDNFPFGVQDELTGALRSFTAAHPDVFLTLLTSSPEQIAQLVLDGSADIGISAIPRSVPEVSLHALFEETMTLYCAATHPLFARPNSQISPSIVASYDCVDVAARQSQVARNIAERMRIRARAGTIHSRMLLILTGKFLGFLPEDFARRWVKRRAIRPLLPELLSYRHTCFAIVRRDAVLSAACHRFLQELKHAFSTGDVRELLSKDKQTVDPQPAMLATLPAGNCKERG
jgi:DNA-binding transcriptional LysR family regulator